MWGQNVITDLIHSVSGLISNNPSLSDDYYCYCRNYFLWSWETVALANSKPLGSMQSYPFKTELPFPQISNSKVTSPVNWLSFVSIFRPIGKFSLTMYYKSVLNVTVNLRGQNETKISHCLFNKSLCYKIVYYTTTVKRTDLCNIWDYRGKQYVLGWSSHHLKCLT